MPTMFSTCILFLLLHRLSYTTREYGGLGSPEDSGLDARAISESPSFYFIKYKKYCKTELTLNKENTPIN